MMIKRTKEIEVYLTYSKKLHFRNREKHLKNMEKKVYSEGNQPLVQFPNQIKQEIVNKVLELRKEHKLGTWRIKWYLERYHDILISESSVYRILKRHNIGRLDRKVTRRAMYSIRYEKKYLVIMYRLMLNF